MLSQPFTKSGSNFEMQWLRRRCGVLTGDVLDTIAGWPADKQHAANQAIKEVEDEVHSEAASGSDFAIYIEIE